MCLAIPGKIISINGENAIINFNGLSKEVNLCMVKAKQGDYVIVHAGFAIQKVEKESAKEIYNYLNKADENRKSSGRNKK